MVLPNMRIKSVEAIPLAASFKEVFRFGMTDRTSSPNVLVRIVTDEGVVGWGEACPVQAFTSETQASVVLQPPSPPQPMVVQGPPTQTFVAGPQ